MPCKTLFIALALVLAPGLSLAQGCERDKATQSTSQCGIGQTWDAATQTCTTPISS